MPKQPPPLFPEFEPPAGRFAARGASRPWTPAEDHVLALCTAACNNDGMHQRMARALCGALGRHPTFVAGARPSLPHYTNKCVSVLECRRWSIVNGEAEIVPPPELRDNIPLLSYGECVFYLGLYVDRRGKRTKRITAGQLGMALGRTYLGDLERWLRLFTGAPDYMDTIVPLPNGYEPWESGLATFPTLIGQYLDTKGLSQYQLFRKLLGV